MEGRVDRAALRALGELLGSGVTRAAALAPGVIRLELENGRILVWKGVPRQAEERWRPGRPWAELVALDALGAAGAAVPSLIACDLEHGWLITEYVEGVPLDAVPAAGRERAWRDLVEGYFALEERLELVWPELEPFAEPVGDGIEALARGVLDLFPPDPEGASAWHSLLAHVLRGERTPGSLDVRGANALLTRKGITFLDFATVGLEHPEKRLVAYARRPDPSSPGLLETGGFMAYADIAGEDRALRLAFFDFLYWGLFLARCKAVLAFPDAPRLLRVKEALGDPKAAYEGALQAWVQPRVDEERVRKVARLARPLLDACSDGT